MATYRTDTFNPNAFVKYNGKRNSFAPDTIQTQVECMRNAVTLQGMMLALGLLALAACETDGPNKARPALSSQIAQIMPDPSMAAFFAEEATRAGVARIEIAHLGPGGDYGMTTMSSATRAPVVRINVDRPGGNSPTNLAHEISHSWAFRHGCYNHGERWLAYHLDIAKRFEARFPGVRWSGKSPTDNVTAKGARYPNDHC